MPTDKTKQPWESRLREGASQAEEEVQRLVKYLNDEVVPEVRRNGSLALKAAASELHKLADQMDSTDRQPPSPPKRP